MIWGVCSCKCSNPCVSVADVVPLGSRHTRAGRQTCLRRELWCVVGCRASVLDAAMQARTVVSIWDAALPSGQMLLKIEKLQQRGWHTQYTLERDSRVIPLQKF